jgi:V/A-type H+-transporting ATPase subunit I
MDHPIGLLVGILILLVGHGINITLAAVAVMVHGIRLNFLEFAKHLNMQWRGLPFVAFSRTPKNF